MELNQIHFKCFCKLNHSNIPHYTWTSEAYHTHFQNDLTWSNNVIATWLSWKSNVEFEFAFQMQYTPFKWNCLTHQNLYIKFQPSIMCLSIVFIFIATSCFVCRVEVEPEQEVTPFAEDSEPEPRQQGKQTSIDHVNKIPLPSHVSLMHCIGWLPCYISNA